ncbi:MAG: hypothetical protein SH868_16025 [Bythopirellula sp.]|nr:hypothetical protein [Bythopirellula sp.]
MFGLLEPRCDQLLVAGLEHTDRVALLCENLTRRFGPHADDAMRVEYLLFRQEFGQFCGWHFFEGGDRQQNGVLDMPFVPFVLRTDIHQHGLLIADIFFDDGEGIVGEVDGTELG